MITTVDLKRINKNRIFRMIHFARETSRHEIATVLDLSLPTVNQNLKLLKDAGLIEFSGNFESTGGRKAQTIVVNEKAKYAISINIKRDIVIAMVINLRGDIVATLTRNIIFEADESYGKKLAELTDEIVREYELEKENILGVGITLPGIFDKKGEYILSAPTLHADNFKVDIINKFIGFPSIVVNDAKSGAYAEIWYNGIYDESKYSINKLEDTSDMTKVYLLLDKGVGGAIITRAKSYEGLHNRAGEFGHMTIVPGGKKCECGKQGCLEAYVSVSRLSDDFDISLEEFFEGLEEDNKEYKKAFNAYVDKLCIGINNIYTIFDSKVVIGGRISSLLEPYLDQIKKKLQAINSFDTNGNFLNVSDCGQNEASIGAALMFLGDYIQSI